MDLWKFLFVLVFAESCFALDSNHLDEGRFAKILKFEYENDGQKSYAYSYESSDGQNKEERGEHLDSDDFTVTGSYSYVGPDGITYTVQYTADKDGFHPMGDHLKVPSYTPWPTNRHLEYEEENSADVSVQRPVNDYLPTSEKPPAVFDYNLSESPSGNLDNSILTTTYSPPVTNAYLPTNPVVPVVDVKTHGGNFYLPTKKAHSEFILNLNNALGSGSTPVPTMSPRTGRSRNLAAHQRAQTDLFEVIQNNHSSRGVFKEKK